MTADYPALVLNADYTPLRVFPLSTWDFGRTLRNVLKKRVTVVETYDTVLRSPSLEYRPPSVVALNDYIRNQDVVPFNRINVFIRDEFCCQYCQTKFEAKDLTFDHVIPRAKGGGTNWENIVAACLDCNGKKGSRQDMKPIIMPTRPSGRALIRKRALKTDGLHKSWLDVLYWNGLLETD